MVDDYTHHHARRSQLLKSGAFVYMDGALKPRFSHRLEQATVVRLSYVRKTQARQQGEPAPLSPVPNSAHENVPKVRRAVTVIGAAAGFITDPVAAVLTTSAAAAAKADA